MATEASIFHSISRIVSHCGTLTLGNDTKWMKSGDIIGYVSISKHCQVMIALHFIGIHQYTYGLLQYCSYHI